MFLACADGVLLPASPGSALAAGFRTEQAIATNRSEVTVSNDWAFTRVKAQQAWQALQSANPVEMRVVAVIDDAVDLYHVELRCHLWENRKELAGIPGEDDDHNGFTDDFHGWDFAGRDNSPASGSYLNRGEHGTLVAGLIAADHANQLGVGGMAPNTKVMVVRWRCRNQTLTRRVATMTEAVKYAVANRAHIVNISGGINLDPESAEDARHRSKLEAAFRDASAQGILVVVSAGNLSDDLDKSSDVRFWVPAMLGLDNIICVTGTSPNPERLAYASGTKTVDIAAPGYNIYGPISGSRFAWSDGASFATPLVSGAAALVWGMMPKLTAVEVRCLLLSNSDPMKPENIKPGEEWGYSPPAKPNGVLDLSFVKDAYQAYQAHEAGQSFTNCCFGLTNPLNGFRVTP